MNKIYFLQKEAVYSHGIYWIGDNLEEGIKQADQAAVRDRDDYHKWVVYEYVPPNSSAQFNANAVDDGDGHGLDDKINEWNIEKYSTFKVLGPAW